MACLLLPFSLMHKMTMEEKDLIIPDELKREISEIMTDSPSLVKLGDKQV